MKRIQAALTKFFFSPDEGHALAALRIVLGVAMLIEATSVFPYLTQLYGPYGFLQADFIEVLTGSAIPGIFHRLGIDTDLYLVWFKCFYILYIGFALAFTLGFKTRYATIGVFISQAILINSGYLSSYGVDRYFLNLSFILVWFPIAQHWSIDQYLSKGVAKPDPSCRFGLRMVQLFLLVTYANAGIAKSSGFDWWNGEAIWRVLNQPEFRRFDFLWLAQMPWLPRALGISTMILETFYVIAVWIPYFGAVWALGIVGMHLGIASSMGLTLFGTTLACLNACAFILPKLPALYLRDHSKMLAKFANMRLNQRPHEKNAFDIRLNSRVR